MKSFKEIFTNTGPKPLFKKNTEIQKKFLVRIISILLKKIIRIRIKSFM